MRAVSPPGRGRRASDRGPARMKWRTGRRGAWSSLVLPDRGRRLRSRLALRRLRHLRKLLLSLEVGHDAVGVSGDREVGIDSDPDRNESLRLAVAGQLAGLDLLLELHDSENEVLGSGRASRHVDVHRHDLVDALDDV